MRGFPPGSIRSAPRLLPRVLLVVLILPAVTNCYSTRAVRPTELRRIHAGGRSSGVVLRADRWRVRLEPNARVRFRRGDGSLTPWIRAASLHVSHAGVFRRARAPLARATRARVEGLSPVAVASLVGIRPEGATVRIDEHGAVDLEAEGPVLEAWLRAFVLETARRTALPYVEAARGWCLGSTPPAGSEPCRAETPDEQALAHLAGRQRGRPLGRWRIDLPPAGTVELRGRALLEAIERGAPFVEGLAWRDIAGAEVHYLSGGKTLAAIVGTTAAAIALAPLGLVARTVPSGLSGGGGDGGGGGGRGGSSGGAGRGGSSGGGSGGPGALRVGGGGDGPPRGEEDGVPFAGLWRPGLDAPRGDGMTRLFSRGARRRAIVLAEVALDAGVDPDRGRASSTASASARLADVFVIGGGVRLTGAGAADRIDAARLAGFVRSGLHLDLDAARRFAVPLTVDLGGGGGAGFQFRTNLGLRVRTGERSFVGIYPFGPTYDGAAGWSFPSTVEIGAAF